MKKLLFISLLSISLYACSSSETSKPASTSAPKSMMEDPIITKGKTLFQANCAACHNPLKDATGPAMKGALDRVPSKEWLYKWVKNSAAMVAEKDPYAVALFEKWNKTAMTPFPTLTNEDIDAIMTYVNQ